jgi:hypothetical protein
MDVLEAMFPVRSGPRLYGEDKRVKLVESQAPSSEDLRMEAEEYPLLEAAT